jgi:hypothetical protein
MGEEQALAAYRRGDSPYVDLARTSYNNPAITKKTHPKEYDLGKRAFLGYGYGMGGPKFKLTCKVQANIDITDEFAEELKQAYRSQHPFVVNYWKMADISISPDAANIMPVPPDPRPLAVFRPEPVGIQQVDADGASPASAGPLRPQRICFHWRSGRFWGG